MVMQPTIRLPFNCRFNQSNMKFYEMLSIKSALKLGNPKSIYIHTNMKPEGKYWDMIKDDSRYATSVTTLC